MNITHPLRRALCIAAPILFVLLALVGYLVEKSLYEQCRSISVQCAAMPFEVQLAPNYRWNGESTFFSWFGEFISLHGWGCLPFVVSLAIWANQIVIWSIHVAENADTSIDAREGR